MDQAKTDKTARQVLVEELIELGTKASNPDADPTTRDSSQKALDELTQRTGTYALLPALNFLIQPGRVPPQLRSKFMSILTLVPLKPDGVRATVEFVFSVHPSNTVTSFEKATPQKQGANITQESLNMASKLISRPPSTVTAEEWFSGVAPQLLALLDGKDGPELMKVAAYVVGFGILGRKESGSPGTAGWTAIAEPMLTPVNLSLASGDTGLLAKHTDEIIDLSQEEVLVSAEDLARALYRLQALLLSHPNPSLSKRLISPVLLPLWALSTWTCPQTHCDETYCIPARNLLKIYLKINPSPEKLKGIIQKLLFKGETTGDSRWRFQETASGDIQVIKPRESRENSLMEVDWNEIDPKVDALLELAQSVSTDEEIAAVFLNLFVRWFKKDVDQKKASVVTKDEEDTSDPVGQLMEAKVLQRMIGTFPKQLGSRPGAILELVEPILQDTDSDEDETISVALSLLNLVVTARNFRKAKIENELLESLEGSLERLSRGDRGDVSATARNLSLLLKYRDELHDPNDTSSAPTDRQVEDRKTRSLALSYITQSDSPPPVRAEGINLLQKLISENSPVLDIPATLVLMSSLLQENDDYINLRVIKAFTQLANKHPKSVTKEILDQYVDVNETATVDTRLRFGEALLQVIERLGETFTGATAQQVTEALLSTAGRRGYRPRTEQKQAKDQRLAQMKQKKAEEQWGGEVPIVGDEMTDEQMAEHEILSQIVKGWDSKKGAEDIRIRASALSILAIGIETNVAGVGATLVSASVDLSVDVLTVESGLETAILRRAAVLVILSFVRTLNKARESRRRLGFGLTQQSQEDISRVLKYIAETDNDELVREHAKDVVESLENWRMGSLVSEMQDQSPGTTLTKLAGLSVNPDLGLADITNGRPRIEEIE